ncbi:M48 family metalloprotease [Candidatus Omnitrophota bacterium]
MKYYSILFLCIFIGGCASHTNESAPQFTEMNRKEIEALHYAEVVEGKLRSQFELTNDPYVMGELNEIARELQTLSQRPYWNTEVFVINDTAYINACTGGRHIYIGQGLLNLVHTDDEKAYIIAHELAHIDETHPMKTFKQATKVNIFKKIGSYGTSIVFAFLPQGTFNPAVSYAAQNSIPILNQVTASIIQKGYKRSFEVEADELAVAMMRKMGYDPQGAIVVLHKLERATTSSSKGVLSDHPSYDHRIEDVQKIIAGK